MDKELKKLKRSDLLEIMIAQSKEVAAAKEEKKAMEETLDQQTKDFDRLKGKLDEKDQQMEHLKEKLNEKDEQINRLKAKLDNKDEQFVHLKEKLDSKDAQIEHLKERLNKKDQQISQLEAELAKEIENQVKGITEIGSLAEAAMKITHIFDVAQEAADEYVRRVKELG